MAPGVQQRCWMRAQNTQGMQQLVIAALFNKSLSERRKYYD
jgi:hypothetical protein